MIIDLIAILALAWCVFVLFGESRNPFRAPAEERAMKRWNRGRLLALSVLVSAAIAGYVYTKSYLSFSQAVLAALVLFGFLATVLTPNSPRSMHYEPYVPSASKRRRKRTSIQTADTLSNASSSDSSDTTMVGSGSAIPATGRSVAGSTVNAATESANAAADGMADSARPTHPCSTPVGTSTHADSMPSAVPSMGAMPALRDGCRLPGHGNTHDAITMTDTTGPVNGTAKGPGSVATIGLSETIHDISLDGTFEPTVDMIKAAAASLRGKSAEERREAARRLAAEHVAARRLAADRTGNNGATTADKEAASPTVTSASVANRRLQQLVRSGQRELGKST